MSENKNHIFTFDNRVISYSVYEQALKDIEALNVENKLLKNQLCFTNSSWPHEKQLHKKIEQLKSDNEKLQAQVNVMREALSKVIKAAEFYSSHAYCRKDSWSCKCSYCRPNDHSINVSHAKKYLKKLEGE